MKTLLPLSLVVLVSSFTASAKAPPPSHKSMTSLMQETRDSYYKSADRKKYLQLTQTFMQKQLGKELGVPVAEIGKKFLDDQKNVQLLHTRAWKDLQSEFYTTLHQQVLFDRWSARTAKKQPTPYGKNIAESMVTHLGKFSPLKEDRFYTQWSSLSKIVNGKNKNFKIPFFTFAPNTPALISINAFTPYEDILAKEAEESFANPSLSNFLRNVQLKTRDDYQELAEKTHLNHLIYVRAVANSAKTIASINYLTGETSLTETQSKVGNFLGEFCNGCSTKEKNDYQKGAIAHTLNTKKEFTAEYTPQKIVSSFCSALNRSNYLFDEKQIPQKPGVVMATDNLRVDRSTINASIVFHNVRVLNKTIMEHDLGVLFLTPSLTRLNVRAQPTGTHLGCTPVSQASDVKLIKGAISDAKQNVEQYMTRINEKVRAALYNPKATDEALEYFAQTNISATAEAIAGFPQGINHVVDTILHLDRDEKRRHRVDSVVSWGGTIIGLGLVVSGIGAPEGLALLLAVASVAKSAVYGSYYLYRSQQEKVFYNELLLAKKGTNVNFALEANLSKHFQSYREMKTDCIIEFGLTALDFAKIHKIALAKSEGDVVKAHGLIKRSLKYGKEIAGSFGEGEFVNFIVESSVN